MHEHFLHKKSKLFIQDKSFINSLAECIDYDHEVVDKHLKLKMHSFPQTMTIYQEYCHEVIDSLLPS